LRIYAVQSVVPPSRVQEAFVPPLEPVVITIDHKLMQTPRVLLQYSRWHFTHSLHGQEDRLAAKSVIVKT
jgi:hypothetical protein